VGRGSALSPPRSRYGVPLVDDNSDGDGHPRSPDSRSLTLAERLCRAVIGSIRRECLDHVIIGNERGLRRVLHAYVEYYLKTRTHLSLHQDTPVSRPVAAPHDGDIVAIPHLGGLHHRYNAAARSAAEPLSRVPLRRRRNGPRTAPRSASSPLNVFNMGRAPRSASQEPQRLAVHPKQQRECTPMEFSAGTSLATSAQAFFDARPQCLCDRRQCKIICPRVLGHSAPESQSGVQSRRQRRRQADNSSDQRGVCDVIRTAIGILANHTCRAGACTGTSGDPGTASLPAARRAR
jgi:hypothetical protein